MFREMPPGLKKKIFIWIEKISGWFTDLIMVENPFDLEIYKSLGVARADKLAVQGNGIDLSRFNPEGIAAEEIKKRRAELGIPEGAIVIGTAARFVYEKGIAELLTAFKELSQKYPKLYLVVAALFFPSEKDLVPRDLPSKMGIADRVLILENMRDMEMAYSLMDIFVLATHRDCFPRSLIEAAAMARPIVATEIDGCKVVIQHEKNGLLVPPKDAPALERALERLVKDPSWAKELGIKAREFALENLNEQKVCRQIADCYQIVLNR
jgi:glycosyltransferase involved in cell wall biosynthesis